MSRDTDIYSAPFVQSLFNEMSATYGVTNLVSSFGFCKLWRDRCVDSAQIQPGQVVFDLMSGMGECWGRIEKSLVARGEIVAIDFSSKMCERSRSTAQHLKSVSVQILEEDVLANSLPTGEADRIVCSFGLKTFTPEQRSCLAQEVYRLLKPGGRFSFVEISMPENVLLRTPYGFYLNRIIPLIGAAFLGNPENYRMLGRYTAAFNNAHSTQQYLQSVGLNALYEPLFGGCASLITGTKPASQ